MKNRIWHINYTEKDVAREWMLTKRAAITAPCLELAIKKFVRLKPECTLWQINHGGTLLSESTE